MSTDCPCCDVPWSHSFAPIASRCPYFCSGSISPYLQTVIAGVTNNYCTDCDKWNDVHYMPYLTQVSGVNIPSGLGVPDNFDTSLPTITNTTICRFLRALASSTPGDCCGTGENSFGQKRWRVSGTFIDKKDGNYIVHVSVHMSMSGTCPYVTSTYIPMATWWDTFSAGSFVCGDVLTLPRQIHRTYLCNSFPSSILVLPSNGYPPAP